MKILVVSIFSQHFFNWILQLKNTRHEIYWIDVFDSNTYVKKIDFVDQTVKWQNRWDYPGRQTVKKHFPSLNRLINRYNRRKFIDVFEELVEEIQPDVVQSFELHSACSPIIGFMERRKDLKWIYSVWGNDLFYYKNQDQRLKMIKRVLARLNYMFADCTRDYEIAKSLGFNGLYLGTFPGGGGYEFKDLDPLILDLDDKKTILIKGYEHKFGRCINILKAISGLKKQLENYNIEIFGANELVYEYITTSELNKWKNLQVHGNLGRGEVLKLMAESFIYIGNSISDGMPNTLLEAVIMGVFPIQSNPGGATAELIEDNENGFLIRDPENINELKKLIKKALDNPVEVKTTIIRNNKNLKPLLERNYIQTLVIQKYDLIEESVL